MQSKASCLYLLHYQSESSQLLILLKVALIDGYFCRLLAIKYIPAFGHCLLLYHDNGLKKHCLYLQFRTKVPLRRLQNYMDLVGALGQILPRKFFQSCDPDFLKVYFVA